MITVNVYGRDFVAPVEIDNDSAKLAAFERGIRTKLEALLESAGVPKETVSVPRFDEEGRVIVDANGIALRETAEAWVSVPDALFLQLQVGETEAPPATLAAVAPLPDLIEED